jgi:uroporphyrinogen decarboxylase
MTPREIVLEQIRHHETHPVPYTLSFEDENTAQALDQHYGGPQWRERITPYMVTCCNLDRRYNEPIDDGYTRDLFGSIWRTDRRPFHLETPGLPEPTLAGYEFPSWDAFVSDGFQEAGCEAVRAHPDNFTIVSVGWGLWESSWGIRGFDNAMMDCVAEPEFFDEFLERLTEMYLAQLEVCRDIPADALMFGDDWGDQRGVMMGPERWRRFFKPRYERLFKATHDQGKLAITHCCGSPVDIIPDLIEIGLDVLESVQPEARGMNPYELKRDWGERITFWGCLGSQSTIPFGTPDEIFAEVRKLRQEMGKGGGFILEPAKPVQPETPLENAIAVLEAFTEEQ